MRKIKIFDKVFYYHRKSCFLFYDYKGTEQVPFSCFNFDQYMEFLKQIQKPKA